jgi:hypothetical protein
MSNGIKIGLLVVLAAALAVVAFKMINQKDELEVRPAQASATSTSSTNPGQQGGGSTGELSKSRNKTTIQWEKTEHDFGTIKQGDAVEYSFKFTNTGSEPLIIEDAKGSCGCTIPKKPDGPVMPGKSDYIKVKFNSAGKLNAQRKTVTITANTEPITSQLAITANVLAPEGGEKK